MPGKFSTEPSEVGPTSREHQKLLQGRRAGRRLEQSLLSSKGENSINLRQLAETPSVIMLFLP